MPQRANIIKLCDKSTDKNAIKRGKCTCIDARASTSIALNAKLVS